MTTPSDACVEVLENWNREQPPLYRVQLRDLLWNLQRQIFIEYRAAQLDGVPIILAQTSSEGERAGYSARSLWLALWSAIPEGREAAFIRAFEAEGRAVGRVRLAIGGDDFHWTCGVPNTPGGERLRRAASAAGFVGEEVVDLVGDAQASAVQAYVAEARLVSAREEWRFEICDDEPAALHGFLAAQFPGRWTREFEFWRDRGDTKCASWGLLRDAEGEALGFARLALRGANGPQTWRPASLRAPFAASDFGRVNDSCLGPIGIATRARGRGVGRALLGLVLAELQARQAGRVCIDWTNALKYYKPLHFKPARSFGTAVKSGI